MQQLNYSDLYRFLVSVGMVFLLGAAAIPWLFLTQAGPLSISAEALAALPEHAQAAVLAQQHTLLWFISLTPYIAGGGTFGGVVCLALGFRGWNAKQRQLDLRDAIDLKKAIVEYGDVGALELRKIVEGEVMAEGGPAQIATETHPQLPDTQGEDSANAPSRESGTAAAQPLTPPVTPSVASASDVERALNVEGLLVRAVSEHFAGQAVTNTLFRLGRLEFDAAVQRQQPYKDFIFEFKRYRLPPTVGKVALAAESLLERRALWERTTHRSAHGVLIAVVGDEVISTEALDRLTRRVADKINGHQPATIPFDLTISFIREGELFANPKAAFQQSLPRT